MLRLWLNRFLVLAALGASGCATNIAPSPVATAQLRAVGFLAREVPAWSRENHCFSCHNNGDAARALYAATGAGYRVPARALADTTAWIARPDSWEHNKGDPGFSDLRLANIQFATSLLAAFDAGHVKDRRALELAARNVMADQETDGAWHIEPRNSVGSPATYGTTLATCLALKILKRAGVPETNEAVRRAERWLNSAHPDNIPAAAALLSALARGPAETARQQEESLSLVRRAQTPDGGWGPYEDSPPEPFDTALVLIALVNFRDVPDVGVLIHRGRNYLVARQGPDGSWPATTRPPGGDSYAQRVSTSAWATLALLVTNEPGDSVGR